MSDTNNFWKDHWEAFLSTLTVAVGSFWVWWRSKKKTAVEVSKIEVDRDIARLNLKMSSDKYIEQIELKFQGKIDILIQKLEASDARSLQLEVELRKERTLRKEVMAELTMYKTIKSTR